MGYAWDIKIPADTLASDPVEETLPLHPGVITKIEVKYPAGCHGMVKVRLRRRLFQLVPLNKDAWLTGDDETVSYPMYFELTQRYWELKFEGCSPGTTYDHTITVRITVLPKAVASMMPLLSVLTKFLKRIGVIR